MTDEEALLDYRRSVAALYARVRQPSSDAAEGCQRFRQERDALFRSHPQSALSSEQKAVFHGLPYYDYNPAFRFLLPVDPNVTPEVLEVELEHDGLLRMRRFGTVHVPLAGQTLPLSLFWLLGYGGGEFLPFGDTTNGDTTYDGSLFSPRPTKVHTHPVCSSRTQARPGWLRVS